MKVGVVSVQGAAPEHLRTFKRAMEVKGMEGEVVFVRREKDLDGVRCLALPGGESTTISKLLHRFDIFQRIIELGEKGVPIMGTCAGCILLAKEGGEEVERSETKLMGMMDMAVKRNAFGRQKESFEAPLEVKGLDGPFPAVFIRAPAITEVWGDCEVYSSYDNHTVMARQENLLGLSFHPELSGDTRIHEMLLDMI